MSILNERKLSGLSRKNVSGVYTIFRKLGMFT